jgi:putative ABC transport system permease protein
MLRNYLKITFRNLFKNKLYSLINIFGLSLGMAGSLIILVYVSNELSYESMHKNADNIVRVSVGFDNGMTLAGSMPGIGPAAVDEIPGINACVRFRKFDNAKVKAGGRDFIENNFFFADSNVFNVFTFPFIEGNPAGALNSPNSVVISRRTAEKYFGTENAAGRSLTVDDKYNFIVAGVIDDPPQNTYLKCDFIAPYSKAVDIFNIKQVWEQWGQDYTFLYMKKKYSTGELETRLGRLLTEHTNENFGKMLNIYVLPLRDIYLKSDMIGELGPTGNIKSIYILTSISFLLLLIACLNFINLTTARSLRRSKEAGLRKVLGAGRFRLIKQFWGESVIITLLAAFISLILFELLNPLLFSYFDVNIDRVNYFDPGFLLILAGVVSFTGLAAGIYPAVFLSKYKPIDSLRGIKTPGTAASNLRRVLVVLQFSISIFLLIGTAAIYKQLNFMRTSNPGFDKKNVLVISYPVSEKGAVDKYYVLRNEIKTIPGVEYVSGVYTLPGINNKEQQSFEIKGRSYDRPPFMQASGVDYDFIKTLGIHISAGRNFSEDHPTDAEHSVIINETAAKELGLEDPVGTEAYIPSGGTERLVRIIGVVKDFHIASFRSKIEPLFLYINPERYYNIAVKIDPGNSKQVIASLKNKYGELFPGKEFNYRTLTEEYNSMYRTDEKTGTLIMVFAMLSVIVASLGLFGLSSFDTELRIKEIGIRKVLGANVFNISLLLSKDFTKWVLIANVIAWPAAYFAASGWLEEFAYKTEIGPGVYILAGLAALLIAVVTISFQCIKTASANPVKSLRYE